jgi:hypothetical protein
MCGRNDHQTLIMSRITASRQKAEHAVHDHCSRSCRCTVASVGDKCVQKWVPEIRDLVEST